MFKAVSKWIIVAVISIAFIGQTLALSIATPCDTSLDAQHANVSEQIKHKIKHKEPASIDTELSAQCCDVDCCDLDCMCITNACSSIVYLPFFLGLTNAFVLTEVVFTQLFEQPYYFAPSLYRPPIFA